MKKLLCFALVVVLAIGCFGCSQGETKPSSTEPSESEKAEPLKVALCVTSLINDDGWCQVAYEGLKQAEAEFGIYSAYAENCQVSDMEAVLTDYAAQGFDLVIGHGFQFADPAIVVGAKYPDTKFAIIEGNVEAENVASYNIGTQEMGYVCGVLGAMVTKTDTLGAVMGIEGPSIIKVAEAFKVGARSVNPDINLKVAYTGTFNDAAIVKEATIAMLDDGADFIFTGANSAGTGAIKACQERGALCIGESSDQNHLAPDTVITSTVFNFSGLIHQAVADVYHGTFKGGYVQIGLADNPTIATLTPYHGFEEKLSQEVKDAVADTLAKIESGEIQVPLIETINHD
jgi:basic membrane protein A